MTAIKLVVSERHPAHTGQADDIKRHASHVTASNDQDGFAAAMEIILKQQGF